MFFLPATLWATNAVLSFIHAGGNSFFPPQCLSDWSTCSWHNINFYQCFQIPWLIIAKSLFKIFSFSSDLHFLHELRDFICSSSLAFWRRKLLVLTWLKENIHYSCACMWTSSTTLQLPLRSFNTAVAYETEGWGIILPSAWTVSFLYLMASIVGFASFVVEKLGPRFLFFCVSRVLYFHSPFWSPKFIIGFHSFSVMDPAFLFTQFRGFYVSGGWFSLLSFRQPYCAPIPLLLFPLHGIRLCSNEIHISSVLLSLISSFGVLSSPS